MNISSYDTVTAMTKNIITVLGCRFFSIHDTVTAKVARARPIAAVQPLGRARERKGILHASQFYIQILNFR